jgi:hypothetical protein
VVGPGPKTLDTESGGSKERDTSVQLHLRPLLVTALEDTLGFKVGGG